MKKKIIQYNDVVFLQFQGKEPREGWLSVARMWSSNYYYPTVSTSANTRISFLLNQPPDYKPGSLRSGSELRISSQTEKNILTKDSSWYIGESYIYYYDPADQKARNLTFYIEKRNPDPVDIISGDEVFLRLWDDGTYRAVPYESSDVWWLSWVQKGSAEWDSAYWKIYLPNDVPAK